MVRTVPRVRLMVAVVLLIGLVARLANGWQSKEPIKPHPDNPRYFLFRGKPTVLVGASYLSYEAWTVRDYVHMLDVTRAHGLNAFRIWNAVSRWPGTDRIHPWARSSMPGAADGGNKYDLDTWNAAYFARLKDLISQASARGIVVEVTLMNGYDNVWSYSPLNSANNIQGVGKGGWSTFLTLGDPALQARQKAVITKVVQELNGFDNVYFEIMNEPDPIFDVAWHSEMIQTIINAEASLSNKHLIAVDGPEKFDALHPKPSVINTHYCYGNGWMGAFEMLDQRYDRDRILGADEMNELPKFATALDGRVEAWEFIVGGGSVYDGLINGDVETNAWDSAEANTYRSYLGNLRNFLSRFNFVRMRRDKNVIQDGVPSGAFARAISEPGKQYALYVHHSRLNSATGYSVRSAIPPDSYHVNLVLALPAGSYRAEWVDPASGNVLKTDLVSHPGGRANLSSPKYSVDIALRLIEQGRIEALNYFHE